MSDKRELLLTHDGSGWDLRVGGNQIWFSCTVRLERGSSLTADPNNRPSRIILECGDTLLDHVAQTLQLTPFQAPPRDEFLVRLAAIEEHLRKLVAGEKP